MSDRYNLPDLTLNSIATLKKIDLWSLQYWHNVPIFGTYTFRLTAYSVMACWSASPADDRHKMLLHQRGDRRVMCGGACADQHGCVLGACADQRMILVLISVVCDMWRSVWWVCWSARGVDARHKIVLNQRGDRRVMCGGACADQHGCVCRSACHRADQWDLWRTTLER